MPQKYHVALSFAGEDRAYVEAVANTLQANGVDVFYDKFEEVGLWGKDLYTHLRNVYQNKAIFTVMFVSSAYSSKLWTNHERESAQARALSESREYILPAFFDETVEVPGLLKTTGHIALSDRLPVKFADLIIQKLQEFGVSLKPSFLYTDEARADVDFPLINGNEIAKLIRGMKTYDWYQQNPAIEAILLLDWDDVSADEAFVLGRNIYQCACGKERRAAAFLKKLRQELATIPTERALDLLNGMFFEVYFNSSGEFRSDQIKSGYLEALLAIQTVKKYAPALLFIQRALEPYRNELPFIPSTKPQEVVVNLNISRGDPPQIKALSIGDRSFLSKDDEKIPHAGRVWRLSYRKFTIETLKTELAEAWGIPLNSLTIAPDRKLDSDLKLELPTGICIRWPTHN